MSEECIAYSEAEHQWKNRVRFTVARELVDQNLDWSEPLQFKFVVKENGQVELWFRTV
jgi:hypothetical protein